MTGVVQDKSGRGDTGGAEPCCMLPVLFFVSFVALTSASLQHRPRLGF